MQSELIREVRSLDEKVRVHSSMKRCGSHVATIAPHAMLRSSNRRSLDAKAALLEESCKQQALTSDEHFNAHAAEVHIIRIPAVSSFSNPCC